MLMCTAQGAAASIRCAVVLCLLTIGGLATAGDLQPYQEYHQRIRAAQQVEPLKSDLFGESVSLFNGQTEFSAVDITLPGNNALPVELRRRLTVTPRRQTVLTEDFGGAGNWEIDVPYIAGTFVSPYAWDQTAAGPQDRCLTNFYPRAPSGANINDIWAGISIHIPGKGDKDLLQALATAPYKAQKPRIWTTREFDTFTCTPMLSGLAGSGFVMETTDGLKYTFNRSVARFAGAMMTGGVRAVRTRFYVLATKVEDRFGNAIDYSYNGQGHPVRIQSSDGRVISMTYDGTGKNLEHAYAGEPVAGVRHWAYQYTGGRLSSVVLPDGATKWSFGYTGNIEIELDYPEPLPPGCYPPELTPGSFGMVITHPSGAVGTFAFTHRRQWRSGISQTTCVERPPTGFEGDPTYHAMTPQFFDLFGLASKTITGSGLAPLVWTYNYGGKAYRMSSAPGLCPTCPSRKISAVSEPGGVSKNHHFGVLFGYNEGKLLAVYSKDQSGAIQRSETYEYMTDAQAVGQQFADKYGTMWGGNDPSASKIRPIVKTVISEGGTIAEPPQSDAATVDPEPTEAQAPCQPSAYDDCDEWLATSEEPPAEVWGGEDLAAKSADTSNFTNQISAFDLFARSRTVTKFSSLGYSKTEAIAYHDNVSKWVLGQVESVTCMTAIPVSTSCNSTDVISKTEYDANAMPWKISSFGKLQQILTYNLAAGVQKGTLQTVSDERDSTLDTTVTLSNWKRGIPQLIQHPNTPDLPGAESESATVDNNGWITSVTDANGYTTNYGYDADMGWLERITYPAGDTDSSGNPISWTSTIIDFSAGHPTEYGLPAGHWRQRITTGTGVTLTYFDALRRPVVKQTYDQNNTAGTLSQVVTRYDASGRPSFVSYPQRNLDTAVNRTWANPLVAPNAKGTRTFYDALDRVTRMEHDSELVSLGGGATTTVLKTITEYLAGFKTRVTLPNAQLSGISTTTSYQAYDQPSRDLPSVIEHPEQAVTEILRDPFGKPLTLKRRNSGNTLSMTRSYAYDGHQRLCRTVEPETAATLFGYDKSGNLAWSASGLPTNIACDPEGDTAAILARKASRTYDARNRLKTLVFANDPLTGNGNGNQTWRYFNDGLPSMVSTWNVPAAVGVEPKETVNTYFYNKRRMLVTEVLAQPAWFTYHLNYDYNANGHLASLMYPSGQIVTYEPNALGQPGRIKAGTQIYAKDISYWPNGAVAQFTYGNLITHSMTPNTRQLPGIINSPGIIEAAYTYDANGNVRNISDVIRGSAGNRQMQYDGLDRLTAVGSPTFGGNHWHRYTYDALDNLASWKLAGVKDYAQYVYLVATNRLDHINQTDGTMVEAFAYDLQGNVTNKSGLRFDFDMGNRLRRSYYGATMEERYRYDAHGRRMLASRIAGPAGAIGVIFSQYASNGQLMYQENDRDAVNKKIDYIYLGASQIAQREVPLAGGVAVIKYQHTDALGSPVAVTDSGGNVERFDYEPFGKVIDAPPPTPAKDGPGYTGHVFDVATGMNYMQQRYYDPQLGRFLSVDPVTANGNTGGNFNRYWYAANNPYRFTDPDGRCPKPTGSNICGSSGFAGSRLMRVGPPGVSGDNDSGRGAKPSFDELRQNYPKGTSSDVMDDIGGLVSGNSKKNGGTWENSCAVRVCSALNSSGYDISAIPGQSVTGGDGKQYIYRVEQMEKYLTQQFGKPVIERAQGGLINHATFAGKVGIIYFDFGRGAQGQSFTGHVDLWDGSRCVGQCSGYMMESERVMLWEMPR